MKLVKKVFVPIYSFRFLSSHSDGPCLIFTSIYINYASHYKRGGEWGKEKTQGRVQSGSSGGNKKRIGPRKRRRTQKTIRSDIRAITSVPRGLSTSSPYGGRNPTLIPAAFLFCFFFFPAKISFSKIIQETKQDQIQKKLRISQNWKFEI